MKASDCKRSVALTCLLILGGCGVVPTASNSRSDVHPLEHLELIDVNQSGQILEYRWQLDERPTDESYSLRGNNVYLVGERQFRVWDQTPSYSSTGVASWRTNIYDGHVTASGEIFDNQGLHAAHRYLKIPCWLEVTNLLNQKKAVVRVNDRGPFHGEHELDLSRGAAEKLGFGDRLKVPVKIDLIKPDKSYYIETDMVFGRPMKMPVGFSVGY